MGRGSDRDADYRLPDSSRFDEETVELSVGKQIKRFVTETFLGQPFWRFNRRGRDDSASTFAGRWPSGVSSGVSGVTTDASYSYRFGRNGGGFKGGDSVRGGSVRGEAMLQRSSTFAICMPRNMELASLRVVDPEDAYLLLWEQVTLALGFYSALITPFEFAFLADSMPAWLTWLDVAVNFCFLADLLLTFFVAFKDGHTYTLVTSHWKIAERYLLSYFLMDLLALFPWNTFYQLAGASGAANLLQWLLWTRVLRMRHLFRYFHRCTAEGHSTQLLRCPFPQADHRRDVHHPRGRLLLLLPRHHHATEDEGYTWIGSLTLGNFSYESFRDVDLFTRYITALYWSVVTMATIGYGDIHPVNPREMIFAMFYITVDLILSAYLIGNITALVVKGSNTTKYRERMAQVIKYMNRNRIPRVLRHQMRQHVRLQFETDQVEDNILNDFPVSIRHKVARALYRRLVEQSYIFQGCSPEFINQIVTKVTPEHYFPSEVVLQHRDSPERLYIICEGSVEETSPSTGDGRHFSELGPGAMFGEVAVLCNIPQPFDVSVIEFCQVLRLERNDLNTAINMFMVDGRRIVDNLLERTTETGSKYALLASEITSLIAQQEAELTMTTIYAASRGDIEHLKRLIKAGANAGKADYDGRTPLHLAAAGGFDEVVRFLLLEGADVNSMDNFGTTPLLEALRAGNDSTAKILTDKSGTVNLQEAGTDLCNAVMRGDTGLLKRLLVNGVNPNAADYDLRTPLHIASAEGFVQVARLLVEHGADVAAVDRWGNSPLDEARRCGSLPLIHLLEEAMRERGIVIGGESGDDDGDQGKEEGGGGGQVGQGGGGKDREKGEEAGAGAGAGAGEKGIAAAAVAATAATGAAASSFNASAAAGASPIPAEPTAASHTTAIPAPVPATTACGAASSATAAAADGTSHTSTPSPSPSPILIQKNLMIPPPFLPSPSLTLTPSPTPIRPPSLHLPMRTGTESPKMARQLPESTCQAR
ncbi:hypothetical protein CLOM_g2072 [Closterium sp. NIES-68]|nr:hypothetical protein CLOM_g2072 [Closterium sp. NIES-68]